MQLHDSHREMQETKARGKKMTMPMPQKGARHRATILIARREVRLGVESECKWCILAMIALVVFGILAAIYMLKSIVILCLQYSMTMHV